MNSPIYECYGCPKGIGMCKKRPCAGTVEDFKRIIDAGYADRLMLEKRVDVRNGKKKIIFYLTGASNNREKTSALKLAYLGRCTFLTADDKCEIHHIKPSEGKVSCCKINEEEHAKVDAEFNDMFLEWDSPEGKALVDRWAKMVDFSHNQHQSIIDELNNYDNHFNIFTQMIADAQEKEQSETS